MAADGDDLRKLPLAMRKTNLARLLARRPKGIFASRVGRDHAAYDSGHSTDVEAPHSQRQVVTST
jgi:hypothetical protein